MIFGVLCTSFILFKLFSAPTPRANLNDESNEIVTASKSDKTVNTKNRQIRKDYVIKANDVLSEALTELEVNDSDKHEIISALRKVFSPRRIRPGNELSIVFYENGEFDTLSYKASPVEIYEVKKSFAGFNAEAIEVPIDIKEEHIKVTLENSLYESLLSQGESPALIAKLVDILAWDIDFMSDPRKDDEITIVVEKQFINNDFYSYGNILAVDYNGRQVRQKAFYFESTKGYYDENGKSLARNFLKSPVVYSRISSKFGARRHPISHKLHSHIGTDFVAPTGTPVWSLSNGKVTKKAYARGNGNYIVVQHNNGYSTYYLHLSKFASGLKIGQRVKQKDIIGYVGSTGSSTGPHLHLSVKYNSKFIDPLKLHRVKTESLNNNQMAIYLRALPELIAKLDRKIIDPFEDIHEMKLSQN